MGKDLAHKRCLSDDVRYADLINGIVFQGEQVVSVYDLEMLDSRTGTDKPLSRRKRRNKREKYHDVVKRVAFGINFAIIGIEGQSQVDYSMALRNLAYEVAEYEDQAGELRKEVRKRKNITGAEYVSGFGKTDKLKPCIMFVMYYGVEPWDGSTDLHGLLDMAEIPSKLRKYISNYQLHIIDVRRMENTNVFRTDLKQIFDYLRLAENKEKLHELVQKDKAYQEVDEDIYDLLMEYTDAEEMIEMKKYQGKEGKVNMCKGLVDWAASERAAGRSEGILEGKLDGEKAGKLSERKEIILELLEDIGEIDEELRQLLLEQNDLETLKTWQKLAMKAVSIKEWKTQIL